MTTITDIVEGSITEREGSIEHTRVFYVTGLTGSGSGKLYSALSAAKIPRDAERHPNIPGIRVISRDVTPAERDPNIARVSVLYGIPDLGAGGANDSGAGQWSFSAELVSEVTTTDINDKRMITEYVQFNYTRSLTLTTTVHEVGVDRPLMTARCRRTERRLDVDKIARYSGAVNSSSWSGFPAQTFLCRIQADANTKGSYDYEYIFHYQPKTWRANLTAKVDGAIPLGAARGNGQEVFEVYPKQNLNGLRLSIPR